MYLSTKEPLGRLAIGAGAIGTGVYVGASGLALTATSIAAVPVTGGLSLITAGAGVVVFAAGTGLVTFGTTVILNEVNGAIVSVNRGLDVAIPTIPTLFPGFPGQ